MAYFDVSSDAYIRFMGRFSTPLSAPFAEIGLAGVDPAARVLDVGCGPGMLTGELVRRRGEGAVSAADPAEEFVAAVAASYPLVDVRKARAEDLPFDDGVFGAALAQLVVHFMSDAVGGVKEMARVAAPGGRVSACVWDHGGDSGPLSPFWRVVLRNDRDAVGEGHLTGSVAGDLARVFHAADLRGVEESRIAVTVRFATFEEWWSPYLLGVGPAGAYVAGLNQISRAGLEYALRDELGEGPFEVEAAAWVASGLV